MCPKRNISAAISDHDVQHYATQQQCVLYMVGGCINDEADVSGCEGHFPIYRLRLLITDNEHSCGTAVVPCRKLYSSRQEEGNCNF